jgi:hypothetical protein
VQRSPTKFSIKIDDKTIQKAREILEEIGRDERITNAVEVFDLIDERFEKNKFSKCMKINYICLSMAIPTSNEAKLI